MDFGNRFAALSDHVEDRRPKNRLLELAGRAQDFARPVVPPAPPQRYGAPDAGDMGLMTRGAGSFAEPKIAPPEQLQGYRDRLTEQDVLNAWRRSPGLGSAVLDIAKPRWRDDLNRTDPTIGGVYVMPGAPY
jgi:hypothetical protein